MNRYTIRFETQDKRVFECVVSADGISDKDDTIRFWRWWGPFRYNAHFISKVCLISVIGDPDNQ